MLIVGSRGTKLLFDFSAAACQGVQLHICMYNIHTYVYIYTYICIHMYMHKHKHKLDTLRLNLAAFQKDILCLGSHARTNLC